LEHQDRRASDGGQRGNCTSTGWRSHAAPASGCRRAALAGPQASRARAVSYRVRRDPAL